MSKLEKQLACSYLRVSKEDGENDYSNSILNQREIIESFSKHNNINILQEFIDDGYSGTNFNRPAFNHMMSLIDKKAFNTIIVKDLSRFGRDYIETGRYLQKVFKEQNIRFISINDNYDSLYASENDKHFILPIKNFINDSYARDISTKIRSVKEVKRKRGEFISSFAPFGYKKDLKNKHKLVVDEEVSGIIERIFSMKIEGYSSNYIAKIFNKLGIITPKKHKENTYTNTNGFQIKSLIAKWDPKMINRIITNKVYIGTLEQGKTSKLNYKSDKIIDIPKYDWIRVENAHQPIVSKTIFLLANKMILRDFYVKEKPNLFSGILYCKDCNSPMIRRIKASKNKNNNSIHYVCSLYNKKGTKTKAGCTSHIIEEKDIKNTCIYVIKNHIKMYDALLHKLKHIDINVIEKKIDFSYLEKEKNKYEKIRKSLNDDLEDGLITSEEFDSYRKHYLLKIKEINTKIENKKEILLSIKTNLANNQNKDILKLLLDSEDNLTRMMVITFIDKIFVEENGTLEFVINKEEETELIKNLIIA